MARHTPRDTADSWKLATKLVRGGTNRSDFGETCEAIFMTSGFRYDSAEEAEARFKGEREGFTYSRLGNPTTAMFEERMAILEGAPVARAASSGMAAVHAALMCQLKSGDRVVSARALFGSCRVILDEILPRFGVTVDYVEGSDITSWEKALATPATIAFLETPANPTLDVIDLKAVAELAHAAGARVVIDNVFATPILQRPMEFGCDVVVYSATKHIDGQGRCLGGAILCDRDFFDQHLNQYLRHTGPSLSPFNAWLLLKGLETLELRVQRHCDNALKVARFLDEAKAAGRIRNVSYPGLASHPQHGLALAQMSGKGGSVVTIEVEGGRPGAFHLMNRLRLIDISNNLGDSKSLITHPSSTTHQRLPAAEREHLGITEGFMRLSVGLEDADDLIDDLDHAIGRRPL
ncbi:O-succinylhomoserine sulfhydrylase [Zavarzinia aquatilis]|uniref:O-succinylhomoserine sulfhydrylase n=1 Tax=Zavarzinia aquatilis TaxID=2211142 RepID=A0A317E7X4_9PROT|nr:O-succinylhomoserine sulfhydrylase [Zavarzinia aquatilis]PWR21205.1 O-succinylhomoserine sulfhydrylase [Zavarzinia aquatilis]